eukprot:CAMPEP_0176495414 /NCGR_PEP_ID=MMETSP0200_2-20121128/10637_1 /TAXON_ID=947934 /ORGANISM="Chaetoceros sp., Strain GSL56" /LENGTH=287 /DNA_ID=CAMNT_0017893277 /DNA_START=250 /DNA_END=1113 /DNA_ORIENTATION=+
MKSNFLVLDFSVEIPLGPMPKWQHMQDDYKIRTTPALPPQEAAEGQEDRSNEDSSTMTTAMTLIHASEHQTDERPCVVGTITFLPNAIMVWIGWGTSIPTRQQDGTPDSFASSSSSSSSLSSSFFNGTGMPVMGPLVVAMPQRHYKGAFGSTGITSSRNSTTSSASNGSNMRERMESPSSQLIGGDQELEIMLGNTMAMRLAQKVGKPVYVSCSLSNPDGGSNNKNKHRNDNNVGGGDYDGMAIFSSIMAQEGSLDVDMEKSTLVSRAAVVAEQKIGALVSERLQQQ